MRVIQWILSVSESSTAYDIDEVDESGKDRYGGPSVLGKSSHKMGTKRWSYITKLITARNLFSQVFERKLFRKYKKWKSNWKNMINVTQSPEGNWNWKVMGMSDFELKGEGEGFWNALLVLRQRLAIVVTISSPSLSLEVSDLQRSHKCSTRVWHGLH